MPTDFTNNQADEASLNYFTSSILGTDPEPKKEELEDEPGAAPEGDVPADDDPSTPPPADLGSESDDGAGDPDDPEGEPAEPPAQPALVWSIEDQEVEITEDGDYLRIPKEAAERLKSGYLRTQDYTKKTTELSESRRQELEAIQEKEQEALKLLDTALVHAQANLAPFAEVDFQKLEQDDPYEAERMRSQYLKEVQKYQEVEAKHRSIQEKYAQQEKERLLEWVKQEQEKVKLVIPQLADESTAKDYATSLVNYGKEVGFQDQELTSIVDHRQLLVLDKARKYDEIMAKRAASKRPAKRQPSPTVRPGSGERPVAPTEAQKRQQAMQERIKSGRNTDDLTIDALTALISKDQNT